MTGRVIIILRKHSISADEMDLEERLPIGKAALTLGVHPQTLRSYERRGLITATRTPGGERRFRLADLIALRDGEQAAS